MRDRRNHFRRKERTDRVIHTEQNVLYSLYISSVHRYSAVLLIQFVYEALFQNMKDIRGDIHSHVVANMIKIIAITVENRNFLHEDVIAENMNIL